MLKEDQNTQKVKREHLFTQTTQNNMQFVEKNPLHQVCKLTNTTFEMVTTTKKKKKKEKNYLSFL